MLRYSVASSYLQCPNLFVPDQFVYDRTADPKHIYLHLDNDEPGRIASRNIIKALKTKYVVKDYPPPSGKDYNDYLKSKLARTRTSDDAR